MPNKHKNRNNNTRKSNASSQSKISVRSENDDDWSSGLIKVKSAPSSKHTTPTSPRPEFFEPLSPKPLTPPPPPPTPWEDLGMTEEDFHAMQERVRKQMMDSMRETYLTNILAEFDSPSYWEERIERLEKERWVFNKKRGWSAADIACVDQIDKEILEAEYELDRILGEVDRLEYEYD